MTTTNPGLKGIKLDFVFAASSISFVFKFIPSKIIANSLIKAIFTSR